MIPNRLSPKQRFLLVGAVFALVTFAQGCPGPGTRGFIVSNCVLIPEPKEGASTVKQCYNDRPLRSVSALSVCPGREESLGLCYQPCREGYQGFANYCWQKCPAGYSDDVVFCRRDAHIFINDNRKCHWLDKCGLTFDKGCTTCPEGYSNDGCTCRKDAHIFLKDSFQRDIGTPMSCAPGLERIGALCYGACPAGYLPDGIYCRAIQQTCIDVPVQEPPLAPLQNFCFTLSQPNSCTPWLIQADTLENAEKLAKCKCENCTLKKIECSDLQGGCAMASPSPSPASTSPSPSSSPSSEASPTSSPG